MNRGQFKDPVSYMCIAEAVVTFWSLIQEMAGSNHFTVMTNNNNNNNNVYSD